MKFWIDCEWNDYKGKLISIALVGEDGAEFYAETPCINPTQWVAEHVMPLLHGCSLPIYDIQTKLEAFLGQYVHTHIIADWPEDIAMFCNLLIVGPGSKINTPKLSFEVFRCDSFSETPHNALADAKGLKAAFLAQLAK